MSEPSNSSRRGFFARVWGFIDACRRFTLNLLFLLVIVIIGVALFAPGAAPLKEKTVLVLNLHGKIVEQKSGGTRQQLMSRWSGEEDGEMQLRDILNTLDAAAKDDKIERVLLMTDDFDGAGLASLREVAAALERVRAAGKQVIAWGGSYSQSAYYLAAHASEAYMHPMGMVMVDGFGRYRNYYRAALDRLGITANIVRVGKYKNAAETYFATGPSADSVESEKFLYDGLWQTYTADVEKARKLPAGSIAKGIDEVNQRLAATNGDAARMALEAKMINGIKTRDELRAMLVERGAKDEVNKTFRQVSYPVYASSVKPAFSGDAVGVIVAAGEISDGNEPAGRIGGRSTSELIRRARDDDRIKAVVLRVDSPGGSAVGSELVRRELELTRAAGKPVVVSMGDVAASGGYWISMSSDEVIADPATITGSIGVFGLLPTGKEAMEKLSINTAGYTTTWLRGAEYDPRRALDPRFEELVKLSIQRIYADFTTKAAAARKTSAEKIDEVGQGRVWTGAQAKERGLVDRLGYFSDAVKSAASRSNLGENPRLIYIESERSKLETLLEQFGASITQSLQAHVDLQLLPGGLPTKAARDVRADLTWLGEMAAGSGSESGKPFAAIVHCLCKP
jgi:protease-4